MELLNLIAGLESSIIMYVLYYLIILKYDVHSRLGVQNAGCAVFHTTNRETVVEIGDSVRGKDIYIVQTGTK